jgi:hypothetical protein
MSGAAPEVGSERDIAAALRLRPDPPCVVRLSRRVLIGLGVAAGLGIRAALIVALQGRSGGEGPHELYSTDRGFRSARRSASRCLVPAFRGADLR